MMSVFVREDNECNSRTERFHWIIWTLIIYKNLTVYLKTIGNDFRNSCHFGDVHIMTNTNYVFRCSKGLFYSLTHDKKKKLYVNGYLHTEKNVLKNNKVLIRSISLKLLKDLGSHKGGSVFPSKHVEQVMLQIYSYNI